MRKPESGEIRIAGHDITRKDVAERRTAGLSHIPEDRHRRGLILDYSIADNLLLGLRKVRAKGSSTTRDCGTKAQIERSKSGSTERCRLVLSEGTAKVVIARERVTTFSAATSQRRWCGCGAIEFIHEDYSARDENKAVLLVSAELNEVLALADRVAVMYRGKFAVVMPAAQASEEVLGEYMIGTRTESAA